MRFVSLGDEEEGKGERERGIFFGEPLRGGEGDKEGGGIT